jgi:hypothetical protein
MHGSVDSSMHAVHAFNGICAPASTTSMHALRLAHACIPSRACMHSVSRMHALRLVHTHPPWLMHGRLHAHSGSMCQRACTASVRCMHMHATHAPHACAQLRSTCAHLASAASCLHCRHSPPICPYCGHSPPISSPLQALTSHLVSTAGTHLPSCPHCRHSAAGCPIEREGGLFLGPGPHAGRKGAQ